MPFVLLTERTDLTSSQSDIGEYITVVACIGSARTLLLFLNIAGDVVNVIKEGFKYLLIMFDTDGFRQGMAGFLPKLSGIRLGTTGLRGGFFRLTTPSLISNGPNSAVVLMTFTFFSCSIQACPPPDRWRAEDVVE